MQDVPSISYIINKATIGRHYKIDRRILNIDPLELKAFNVFVDEYCDILNNNNITNQITLFKDYLNCWFLNYISDDPYDQCNISDLFSSELIANDKYKDNNMFNMDILQTISYRAFNGDLSTGEGVMDEILGFINELYSDSSKLLETIHNIPDNFYIINNAVYSDGVVSLIILKYNRDIVS